MASHLGQRNRHTTCTGCGAPMTTYSDSPLCRECRALRRDRVCPLCGDVFRLRVEGHMRSGQACPECRTLYLRRIGGQWSPLLRKKA